jgi:hypothetical protein
MEILATENNTPAEPLKAGWVKKLDQSLKVRQDQEFSGAIAPENS